MTLLSYPNPALARAYYYKPIQTKKPTKGNLSGEKLLALIAVKGPNIGKGWLLKPNLASRARKQCLKGKSSGKEPVVEAATIVQAGWLKSAKQARNKQASKLKEILVWQSMLASSGQLVKLVTYFKHALGSSMLRGSKPISSKLNRSCLKGRQIKTNKAREAESASYSQLSAWTVGQPRRNTYSYRIVIELAQKRGYAYMYVIGEWLALLNRQKQQPFKRSNRLSVGAIGSGGGRQQKLPPPLTT